MAYRSSASKRVKLNALFEGPAGALEKSLSETPPVQPVKPSSKENTTTAAAAQCEGGIPPFIVSAKDSAGDKVNFSNMKGADENGGNNSQKKKGMTQQQQQQQQQR